MTEVKTDLQAARAALRDAEMSVLEELAKALQKAHAIAVSGLDGVSASPGDPPGTRIMVSARENLAALLARIESYGNDEIVP